MYKRQAQARDAVRYHGDARCTEEEHIERPIEEEDADKDARNEHYSEKESGDVQPEEGEAVDRTIGFFLPLVAERSGAVSYTHLTLPTSDLV